MKSFVVIHPKAVIDPKKTAIESVTHPMCPRLTIARITGMYAPQSSAYGRSSSALIDLAQCIIMVLS